MEKIAQGGTVEEARRLAAGVEGWLTDPEGALLFELARQCTGAGVIVEVGSWKGKSTTWLGRGSKAGRGVKVYAIDPHVGSPEHREEYGEVRTFREFQENVERAGVADVVTPIVKPSVEAAPEVREPVELAFIDGDHSYDAVLHDFEAWFPKLIVGGIMAFHDSLRWPGPRQVVRDHLFKSGGVQDVGFVDSITFARKGGAHTVGDFLRRRTAWWVRSTPGIRRKIKTWLPKNVVPGGRTLL